MVKHVEEFSYVLATKIVMNKDLLPYTICSSLFLLFFINSMTSRTLYFLYSRGHLQPPWSELTWCHGLY